MSDSYRPIANRSRQLHNADRRGTASARAGFTSSNSTRECINSASNLTKILGNHRAYLYRHRWRTRLIILSRTARSHCDLDLIPSVTKKLAFECRYSACMQPSNLMILSLGNSLSNHNNHKSSDNRLTDRFRLTADRTYWRNTWLTRVGRNANISYKNFGTDSIGCWARSASSTVQCRVGLTGTRLVGYCNSSMTGNSTRYETKMEISELHTANPHFC